MATLSPPKQPAPAADSSPSHLPTNAYTAGLPAPPRILIPPPTVYPDFSVGNCTDTSSSNGGGGNGNTMDHLLIAPDSVLPGTLQDWKYESRREAQQLLPHLWLGPLSASKNSDFIRRANITLLLAVRASISARANLLAKPPVPGVRLESIDVAGNQELIASFQRASLIIDEHYLAGAGDNPAGFSVPVDGRRLLAYCREYAAAHDRQLPPGGNTLVYCESGNERSATVAAAYIMQHLGVSAVQSIQMIQGKRFCVCFDDATKWLLTSYEPIWTARRQALVEAGVKRGKRTYDDRGETSEDEEEGAGAGFAPFEDRGADVEMC